jgi:hypothetical protein
MLDRLTNLGSPSLLLGYPPSTIGDLIWHGSGNREVLQGMGKRREPRKEIQVPVRIFGTDSGGHVFSAKAVTVNVSHQGVALSGVESHLNLDEVIGLSYGQNRVHFRVKWVGQPGTPKAGHVGLVNVSPEKPLWDFPLPSAVPDTHQPQIVQQRRHPRFKCHNSVEIHTQEGATFWATIADLSVGGCYVEMAIPLQPGHKIKVGIWIGESKAWADCDVVYSTAGCGVGLKFIKISESDLERIREFLSLLAPFAKKPTFEQGSPEREGE